MLEEIRMLIGSRFVRRFEQAQKWESRNLKLVPFVDKKLREIEGDSRNVNKVVPAGDGEFDAIEGRVKFSVKLKKGYCDCHRWQITGIPCKHAARCILRNREQLEDYVDDCFTVERYKNTYNTVIHPIPDPMMWEKRNYPELDPPYHQKKMGRPELHRRRESVSSQVTGSGTTRCKKCGRLGHNKLTCGKPRDEFGRLLGKRQRIRKTVESDEAAPKRPRGRPRKDTNQPTTSTTPASRNKGKASSSAFSPRRSPRNEALSSASSPKTNMPKETTSSAKSPTTSRKKRGAGRK